MSIAPDESPQTRPQGDARRVTLRVIALLASLGAIGALWFGERQKANYDLQLLVQRAARPGSAIALRALLLGGMEAVQGPHLEPLPVRVSLLSAANEEIAHAVLEPDALDTMGGSLRIPEIAPGRYTLAAEASVPDAAPARVRTTLQVSPEGGRLEAEGRVAGPLQHLALGRVRPVGDGPQAALEVRVPGGVCIPEQPCELLVRMGEPGFALQLTPSASVSLAGPVAPTGETAGLARARVVVHGPEAEASLRATRDGRVVSERSVRLPVGLGEVALWVERAVLRPGQAPRYRVHLPPGRSALVLDAYSGGDWRQTTGIELADGAERPREWPGGRLLGEGLWQLQARADPFSSGAAGVRVVFVRAPGLSDEALLRQLDRAAVEAGGSPLFEPEAPLPDWAYADTQAAAAFLLAPLEGRRVPQPTAVSGRPTQLRRLSYTRNLLRFSVGAMLLLSAFVVSGTMVRRELDAQALTRNALRDAGDEFIDLPRNRRRQAFWLWSMALGVALAFVLAALLIVAKPLWF